MIYPWITWNGVLAIPNERRNIVLTGFMATGKTTVGRLVAERLQRRYLDMDAAIETRTGWSIPRIFAEHGEEHFRALERGLCFEVALLDGLVVSTGGGTLVDPQSREVLRDTTMLVCLLATPESIKERLIAATDRPLAPRWRELYAARRPIYESVPHQVHTDGKSPQDIAEEVIRLWHDALM